MKFNIHTDGGPVVLKVIKTINNRLKSDYVYIGKLQIINRIVYVEITPLVPDLSAFGLIVFGMMFVFRAPLWLYPFLLPFVVLHLFHTKYFYYLLIRRVLRKAGYTGGIKYEPVRSP